MTALKYLLLGLIFAFHLTSTANPDSDEDTNIISSEDFIFQQELLELFRSTKISIRNRMPALHALKQFPSIEVTVQRELMEFYFETNSSTVKKAIIQFFGEIKTTDTIIIQKLAEIANNPEISTKIRIVAIQALGKIQPTDEATQLILVRLGIYSRYKALRRIAKLILKQIPLSKTAIAQLAKIANSNETPLNQRITAIRNLRRINQDKIAAPLIVEIADNEQNPDKVRIEAIQIAKDLPYGDNHTIARRLAVIYSTDSNSPDVQETARNAIEEMGFSHLLSPNRCMMGFFRPIPL